MHRSQQELHEKAHIFHPSKGLSFPSSHISSPDTIQSPQTGSHLEIAKLIQQPIELSHQQHFPKIQDVHQGQHQNQQLQQPSYRLRLFSLHYSLLTELFSHIGAQPETQTEHYPLTQVLHSFQHSNLQLLHPSNLIELPSSQSSPSVTIISPQIDQQFQLILWKYINQSKSLSFRKQRNIKFKIIKLELLSDDTIIIIIAPANTLVIIQISKLRTFTRQTFSTIRTITRFAQMMTIFTRQHQQLPFYKQKLVAHLIKMYQLKHSKQQVGVHNLQIAGVTELSQQCLHACWQ
ncbi:unnamed protein product [Paramecium sonneborni]|uniref:Uncharacterized protein n=1 Tax=Paramecium sonneborni TaxID=65129 RepID=A0A8S1RPN8_9CILI|nr:unnamed protein product [Paramecium sonneborni]